MTVRSLPIAERKFDSRMAATSARLPFSRTGRDLPFGHGFAGRETPGGLSSGCRLRAALYPLRRKRLLVRRASFLGLLVVLKINFQPFNCGTTDRPHPTATTKRIILTKVTADIPMGTLPTARNLNKRMRSITGLDGTYTGHFKYSLREPIFPLRVLDPAVKPLDPTPSQSVRGTKRRSRNRASQFHIPLRNIIKGTAIIKASRKCIKIALQTG